MKQEIDIPDNMEIKRIDKSPTCVVVFLKPKQKELRDVLQDEVELSMSNALTMEAKAKQWFIERCKEHAEKIGFKNKVSVDWIKKAIGYEIGE